jgi:hypothetical protein
MSAINTPRLTVTTKRPTGHASVLVSCEIEFTDVEVNAMNMLGLEYRLTCQVLNKNLLDEVPVISYNEKTFPLLPGEGRHREHIIFDSYDQVDTQHNLLIGKDKLVAEIHLRNLETHAEIITRTETIEVDLAA